MILGPLMFGPVLLGAFWTMLAAALLGVCCHLEFSRAAGIQRHWGIHAIVILGIFGVMFAGVVGSPLMVGAVAVLGCCGIAGASVLADQPKGYLHRVSLGILSFMLFGVGLGHLGQFTMFPDYRPILLMLIFCAELNDILAYVFGNLLRGPKLAPATSPNKTVSGAACAMTLTMILVVFIGQSVFRGTPLDSRWHLVTMGALVALPGVVGDLVLSSIKRDLGIKDMAATFPGHGGWLDRFNSLLLAAPALFYYVVCVRSGVATRIFSDV
jgi:phosphatidate cytidylyltransferase